MDYPDVGVANVYAVLDNNEEVWLGEVRAYNFETYWLSTTDDEEVDTAKNWKEIILNDYEKLLRKNTK